MKVLQDWNEIGDATTNIKKRHLPCHSDVYKDWDLWNIYELVKDMDRDIYIFDFGCAGCRVLKFLNYLGFRHVYGMDLYESKRELFIEKAMMALKNSNVKVIHGNGLRSGFNDSFFDVVICLSVIEHNVDIEHFLKEVYRVLKPGGILYLSTDYWEDKIVSEDKNKVFSEDEIENMLSVAEHNGFSFDKNIPRCKDKVVYAHDKMYTFISGIFRKQDTVCKEIDEKIK